MIDLNKIGNWLVRRKLHRERKQCEKFLMQLHCLSVTIHGRFMLKKVIEDPDNGLPEEIRIIYFNVLQHAPIDQMAQWN